MVGLQMRHGVNRLLTVAQPAKLLTAFAQGDRIGTMPQRFNTAGFTILATLFASAAPAEELPGDARLGHALALEICAQCHEVETRERDGKLPDPPAFQNLADDPAMTALALRVFLHTPHANMPNLILSDADVDDVIAYIHSLKSN
jgi:mono/diheme cytochrome c family protein